MMDCPKCGHKQDQNHAECVKCGVIFSKVKAQQEKQESSEKQHQPNPQKEFAHIAGAKFNKLDPGINDPAQAGTEKPGPTENQAAVRDLPTLRPSKSIGAPGNRAFKIVFITLLFIVFIPFACNKILDNLKSREREVEKFDLSYNQYLEKTDSIFKIPETSEYIDIFSYQMRDYSCNAVQAEVRSQIPGLHAIVSDYILHDVAHPAFVENVSSPMDALAMVVGANGAPRPSWLQTNDTMHGFNKNLLKYGWAGAYGRGVWAFYDENMQTLRVFSWSIQHLPIELFTQTLDSSKDD